MDIRRLDLNLLLLLNGLYREQNLSTVARRLGLSQPAASAGLRKLREFFGDPLFLSTGRGMRPTPFAESIAASVLSVLTIIQQEILRKPVFVPEKSKRTFTVTTADIGVLIFLPPLLQRMQRTAPCANLHCVACPHAELEEKMERGAIDLAIGYFPDLAGPNIAMEDLFDHPFTCIVSEKHSRIGNTLSLEQFLSADHLVVTEAGRSQEIFERRVSELKLERRILLQLPHFMSVPQLIARSEMIATVPYSLGASYVDVGLKLLPPPMQIPRIELRQFWHRRLESDPAVNWLRGIVSDELRGRDPVLATTDTYANIRR